MKTFNQNLQQQIQILMENNLKNQHLKRQRVENDQTIEVTPVPSPRSTINFNSKLRSPILNNNLNLMSNNNTRHCFSLETSTPTAKTFKPTILINNKAIQETPKSNLGLASIEEQFKEIQQSESQSMRSTQCMASVHMHNRFVKDQAKSNSLILGEQQQTLFSKVSLADSFDTLSEKKEETKNIVHNECISQISDAKTNLTILNEKSSGLKDINTIIQENKSKQNCKNLNTNFPLYKKNANDYISYLENILANPEQYPYSDKDTARIKSIISSQVKRINEFEKKLNRNTDIKSHTKKRNQKLDSLISVLDEKLDESLKVRLMKRMRNEFDYGEINDDEIDNFEMLTRKILF